MITLKLDAAEVSALLRVLEYVRSARECDYVSGLCLIHPAQPLRLTYSQLVSLLEAEWELQHPYERGGAQ